MDTLATILYVLIALSLSIYLLLDGYTLGVGLSMPFLRGEQTRESAIHSVTPFWDANQTWLVFAVSALYGAYPSLYSTILPAFYLEIIVLLMLLFVRGIVFEFYEKFSQPGLFQALLFLTALTAAYLEGAIATQIVIGNGLLSGPSLGDIWRFESMLGGAAFILGYAVLGNAWLRMTRPPAGRGKTLARHQLLGALASLVVALWLATCVIEQPSLASRLHDQGQTVIGLVATSVSVALLIANFSSARVKPFLWVSCPLMLVTSVAYVGLYPELLILDRVQDGIVSPRASLIFLLVGLAIVLPMILAYTLYSYRSLLKR